MRDTYSHKNMRNSLNLTMNKVGMFLYNDAPNVKICALSKTMSNLRSGHIFRKI